MADLVVRRLLIDLKAPFPARWNGGDAFRSALFNALSLSFPVGESYFIDSVRNAQALLPAADQLRFAAQMQAFVGQEATHRHLHSLFNTQLQRHGLHNQIEHRSLQRLRANAQRDARMHLAATAATEHLTALFADWLLRHPEALAGAEPRLQALWLWHSAEESEHRSTAFTLYQAVSGHHGWRVRIFHYITVTFLLDLANQTLRNLWHDRALLRWQTWRSATSLLLGRDGLVRGNVAAWRRYKAVDFHPAQQDASAAQRWLADNAAQFLVVGQAR